MAKSLTLKQWRVLANYTQSEAAKKLGVTTTTICNWETGKSEPKIRTIKKIMRVYRIDDIDDIKFNVKVKSNETKGVRK